MRVSRFDGADFANIEPIQITPDLTESLGGGYRCIRGEFVTFLKQGRIKREIESELCRCWGLTHNGKLAGYITLLTDKLTLDYERLAEENIRYTTYPAVKIGLLCADERAKGAGRRLVDWALFYVATEVVQKIGVRFITVDAFYDLDKPHYDASGFYERLGFEFVDPDEPVPPAVPYRSMFFDLMPLIAHFKNAVIQEEAST
ncbi:GNAT family N-acetyltransferase [Fibrella sp. HMF5335]|uniref:GNAT family N-acetyltransferase n=1 Tax=Fibrella rubiginis TaxID=2817060 RepID=A0A939K5M1_9BACT|nr:GNAT family N-acetyltransferase [Fibrella rubiginis]